jgi:hypothetical protein
MGHLTALAIQQKAIVGVGDNEALSLLRTRPSSPAAVEQIYRILAEAVTSSENQNLITPFKTPEAPGEEMDTK